MFILENVWIRKFVYVKCVYIIKKLIKYEQISLYIHINILIFLFFLIKNIATNTFTS